MNPFHYPSAVVILSLGFGLALAYPEGVEWLHRPNEPQMPPPLCLVDGLVEMHHGVL
jgi:hypothetical protein